MASVHSGPVKQLIKSCLISTQRLYWMRKGYSDAHVIIIALSVQRLALQK